MFCPKCSSDNIRETKDKAQSGKSRWKCRPCGHRTTSPLSAPNPLTQGAINKSSIKGVREFVITNAVCNASLHKGFYSLKAFSEAKNAQLIVIPTVYNWQRKEEVKLHDDVTPYLLTKDLILNKNIMIKASNLRPTLANPLSGKAGIGGTRSCVFGHPQVAMEMIATPKSELPRMLHTTGACTNKYYSKTVHGQYTNEGEKGALHHSIGGLYVKIKGNKFWTRELICSPDGSFIDLGEKWTPDGMEGADRVPCLVLGDVHAVFLDDKERKATIEQIKRLKPEHIVIHDLHDNYADSHHHKNNYWLNYHKQVNQLDGLRAELQKAAEFVDEVAQYGKPVLVHSNHHDHLEQWFNRHRPNGDRPHIENDALWSELHTIGRKHIDETGQTPNLFNLYLQKYCKNDFEVTSRNKPYMIAGVDVSQHGDKGANGGRGHSGFIKSAFKMFLGHSHTPKIQKGAWWVGVLALNMGYALGLSSWFVTNGVINENGKRQLLHIIDGDTGL
ncbi:MAG: hypothetical protein SVC26_02425 [Pseudomonadota bacterium]|nr:hypothetical protein [Pseudomonadota bacterium]